MFTDRYMNGNWDFPLPPDSLWHAELIAQVQNHSPAVELMQVSSETPEYFDVPPGVELLEFHYDVASFRGDQGKTELEVYLVGTNRSRRKMKLSSHP